MILKKKIKPKVGHWVDVGFFGDTIHVGLIVETLFSGGFRVFFPSGMGLRTVDAGQICSIRWEVRAPKVLKPRKRVKKGKKVAEKAEKSAISA
jgi:hypothetical protein